MSGTHHTASNGKWKVKNILDIIHMDPIIIMTASFACILVCSGALPFSNGSSFFPPFSAAHFVCSLNKFEDARILYSRLLFHFGAIFPLATFTLWQIYGTGY